MEALEELLKQTEEMLEHHRKEYDKKDTASGKWMHFGAISAHETIIKNIKDKIQIYGDK